MVQRVSEDEWRQLKAFSEVYGKHSMQFKLMALLRSMKEYDPQAEKLAFADADLYSLRKKAKRWLIRTGRRLAFDAKEVEEQHGDVEMLIAWGHFVDAWDFVAEAKGLASSQEEFVVMAGLLKQEKLIARELFAGEELTLELQRIVRDEKANNNFLQLATAMAESTAHYLEPVKNKLAATGVLDHEAVAAYFDSEVFKSDVQALPISIQIEKLTLDEFFYNMSGRFEVAAEKAMETVRLLKAHPAIKERSPDKLPRTLMNLAAFYAALNRRSNFLDVVGLFEAESPDNEAQRKQYLSRYIFVLFMAAMDLSMSEMAQKGISLIEEHAEFLRTLPFDSTKSVTILYACWYYLGQGKIEEARSLFRDLGTIGMRMPRLLYQSMFALLHLALLFEEEDEVGLQSIGLQYRRKLRNVLPPTSAPMMVLTVLRSKTILNHAATKKKALTQLASDLRRRQLLPDEERSVFYDPLIKWIEHLIGRQ